MSDLQRPTLHYEMHPGEGPHLLLVHGMLSGRSHWLPNLRALREFTTPVVVELFGHGRSPSPEQPERYHPEAYVEEFEAIREAVGAERWFICGQSLGASLTLRYALDRPERVIAQVWTNSASAFPEEPWAERIRPGMERQMELVDKLGHSVISEHRLNPARNPRLPDDLREALEADIALHSPHGFAMTGLHTLPYTSLRARAGEITVPTLLALGEREQRFHESWHWAEQNIPQLEVAVLDAGHGVNIDDAEGFNEALRSFFGRFTAEE